MQTDDRTAPRALLHRSLIPVQVTSLELSLLIRTLEARAMSAADDPEMIDFADFLFRRIAELREAFR